MTPLPQNDLDRLRQLLRDSPVEPVRLAAKLAALRMRLLPAGATGQELLTAEWRWLHGSAEPGDPPELHATLAAARRALLELQIRNLLAAEPGDPIALLDLAEVAAECTFLGLTDAVAACEQAIGQRLAHVQGSPRLREEAAERFAVLTTEEEDLPLRHATLLLERTGCMFADLAVRTGDRWFGRLARRLRAAAEERQLALRLERLLGRRGAVALETSSFVLLLTVLALLVLESTVALTPGQSHVLQWVDALACLFFVLEFALRLAVAPRRLAWFLRNFVTDLLPSIPAVLFLLPTPTVIGAADEVVAIRVLRLFRLTWAARYVQALRPLLRTFRLLLFLVRGMDGLSERFSSLLNRNFVFFAAAEAPTTRVQDVDLRAALFAALERERSLLARLPGEQRTALLAARARGVAARAGGLPACWLAPVGGAGSLRDIPVEDAVELLWSLQPEDLGRWLSPADVRALDRVVRVTSAPFVRWLPFVRRVAVAPLPPNPEERLVAAARRVAEWLQGWHQRAQFWADLHGIVTGPQILDRVSSAMVKASQRPAVRLILFGGVFLIVDLLFASDFVARFVGLPLLVLGSVCLVFLTLGWWLKRIAGEASEQFRMTCEASFASLLHLAKRRHERQDLEFLARRVFGDELANGKALALLREQVQGVRTGVGGGGPDGELPARRSANSTALLYLHFLDGALLHASDIKTTEQLLANLSLENLRQEHLAADKRDRKRLKRLRLDDGSLFSGPYLWFRFITESVIVETAKRITDWNRHCLTTAQQASATPAERERFIAWIAHRRDPRAGRTIERLPPPGHGGRFLTTEFSALDFVAADPERDEHVRALFGDAVLAALCQDRRNMIREIFGTRPVHLLPRHERSFNAHAFYRTRMANGRVFLLPLFVVLRALRSIGWVIGRLRQITREVLRPHLAQTLREPTEAPYAVAMRKIHRMKAPGLLESIRLRVLLDPSYSGAPTTWSATGQFAVPAPLEQDLDFLHLRDRERAELRKLAAASRRRIEELHGHLAWLPDLGAGHPEVEPALGQFAVTVAFLCDRGRVRTLLTAEAWRARTLPALAAGDEPGSWLSDCRRWLLDRLRPHPVDLWLQRHRVPATRRLRRNLRRAWAARRHDVRAVLEAWLALPPDASPTATAIERLRAEYGHGDAVWRDVVALRTVQSLAVLDIRNYRDLVFRLGRYAEDGEDPGLSTRLP
ncbi:MAG: hypothetical protein IPK26_08895 [Planctomycetes bacterium]|nr:hypothetical protein [Planctomycetota bacterium]